MARAAARKGVTVNDRHSRLNRTEVADVVAVDSAEAVRAAVAAAREDGLPVAVAGARHAMGGQQFCTGGVVLDATPLARIRSFDRDRGIVEAEAGVRWPELLAFLRAEEEREPHGWSIRQKQTGADRLTIGGAVAANVHGRGLAFPPVVDDLEFFELVDTDGELRRCSRDENAELFRLAVGGYGLFGVVVTVALRLARVSTLERVVEVRPLAGLVEACAERVREGFLYGDLQFAIDPADPDFLRRGVFSCYRPVEGDPPIPAGQRALTVDDWKRLLLLTHTDKAQAWARYSAHYLATSGQLYRSDGHQFADYVDDYHDWLDVVTQATPGSEMISELYVPRDRLEDFMDAVAEDFRRHDVNVVYGTIRMVERDEETVLAWARERWACVIFNLHVEHTDAGIARAAEDFRRLIDRARERGGSYFLTYHRWASADQLAACYPRAREFFAAKRRLDPVETFQSDWYRHYAPAFS
jgi:FAD/FMN-containing dehydrogenase